MGSKARDYCRLCACKCEDCGVTLFGSDGQGLAIGSKIRRYLRLEIRENDDLSQKVCPKCCSTLDCFHKFAEDCLRVQEKLVSRQVTLRMKAILTSKDGCSDSSDDNDFCVDSNLKLEWDEGEAQTDLPSTQPNEQSGTSPSEPQGVGTRRRSRKQSMPSKSMLTLQEDAAASASSSTPGRRGRGRGGRRGASRAGLRSGKKNNPSPPPPILSEEEVSSSSSESEREADPDFQAVESGSEAEEEEEGEEEPFFPMVCHVCGESKSSWKELGMHCKEEHGTPTQFKCVCGKLLTRKKQMRRHQEKHGNSAKYRCEECGKGFCKPSHLEVHLGTHLPKSERPFQCSQCPKRFHTEVLVRQHEKTHVPLEMRAIWQCDICNKKLCTKNSLETHQKNIHMGERSYVCDICGRTFTQKGILKDHLVTHSDETPFSCDKCGKRFKTKPRLKIHLEVHREDPLVCPVCGMLLATSRTLKIHMATHSNDRPYRCVYCNKGFKRSKDLKGHYNYHEGKKPYQCRYCGRCFTNSGNCRSHKRRMHLEELRKEGRPPTTKKVKGSSSSVSSDPVPVPSSEEFQGGFQTYMPREQETGQGMMAAGEGANAESGGAEGQGVMQVISQHAAGVLGVGMFPHAAYGTGFPA